MTNRGIQGERAAGVARLVVMAMVVVGSSKARGAGKCFAGRAYTSKEHLVRGYAGKRCACRV